MERTSMERGGSIVVVGGTRGIGLELARHFAGQGRSVWLTGRDRAVAEATAAELGGDVRGIELDLSQPTSIEAALTDIGSVWGLILSAIDRDQNTIADYDIERAIRLVTLKLVGYSEVIHRLRPRLVDDAAIVLFGGQAKDVPYPGSTTVSTVNGGIEGLTRSLVHELKPIRVNCLHPGIVGDSPFWETRKAALEATLARTPTARLTTMSDIIGATEFLLVNPAMNGVNLKVDGGLHCT
jgi:NAD(P)-dependent dehydrogenase (short-subunit alcohol dehydrogenase family)